MPVLIAGGLGVAETVTGLINSGKAKKQAAELERNRPLLKDSSYLNDQLSLAKSELANGMSSQAENAYQQGTDRGLSASLNAILKGGGSVNNVSDVFDQSQQGRARLALMNDNLRLAHINNLVKSQDANEQFRQQQFGINEYKPWADKTAANAQARAGAEGQIWGGLNQLAGAATTAFAPSYNGVFSKGGKTSVSGLPPQSVGTRDMTTMPLNATPSVAANYPKLPTTLSAPALNYNSLNTTPMANAATGWQGIPYAGVPETIPQYGSQFDF